MNQISAGKIAKWDKLKWIVIFACLVAGVGANHYFHSIDWSLRAAVGIVLLCALLVLASRTSAGQHAWNFIKSARAELRKVVWPTRPETLQTTAVVIVMVAITAMILWGVDAFFLWAVSWITGQRG